jgi:hypothetical protein
MCSSFAAGTEVKRVCGAQCLSSVTELTLCVVFHFNNIIIRPVTFTVVLSTQREQNAKREHRFYGNKRT